MTYDEYMEFVNAPAGGGRTIGEILGIDLSGIVPSNIPGRLGSAAAGMAGSALAGTGGGLIGSGIYDAVALRNQAREISNRQGFTPQLSFWDYLMAALPFVSPESRIRNTDWRPDPSESPEPSEEDYARMSQGDWWDMVNDPARNTPRPEDRIDVESLPPPEIGTNISTLGNIYDEPAAWQEMADQLGQYSQENYGPLMPPQEPIPPIEQGPLSSSPISDFTTPTSFYTPEASSGPVLSQPASPISPVANSGQNVYDWIENLQNVHGVVPDASGTALTVEREDVSAPSRDEITQFYEDQYGDYGGWYGAKGGPVSAFAGGGPATEHGKQLKADKEFWKKHGKDFLEKLADKMSQLSPEAREEAETDLFHDFPMGLYSSKIAEIWPEEYAPFGGKDLEGEPIPVPVPDHYHRELFQGGGMVRGPGSGMDDMVPATIEGRQMAKLSNDEFVIPADVVSDLGDGSSNAGHKKLYQFISDIRQAKTGNSSQPPKLMSALRGLNENSRGIRPTFISDVIQMKKAINAGGNDDRSYAAEYIRAIKSVMEAA